MTNASRRIPLAAALAAMALPAAAAGPFSVYRAGSASTIAGTPPAAVVTVSPFDDDASRWTDGHDYYYAVADAAGTRLPISVHLDRAAGRLRIAFDDLDPASAPVAPALSSVGVAPATIPADGFSVATVTIVPRDANGLALGTGLTVSIAPARLWPGRIIGPIADLGDGRYRAAVVSSFAGSGIVQVAVEGIPLSDEPSITFEPFAWSGSLRDEAIRRLTALAAPDGPLAASPALAAARAEVLTALAQIVDGGPDRDDNALKPGLELALADLASVSPAASGDAASLAVALLDAARMIAMYHLEQATAACGPCERPAGEPSKVCDAEDLVASGDAIRLTATGVPDAAAQQYGLAVEKAQQALDRCE